MPHQPDQRQSQRVPLPGRPAAQVRVTEAVRLLDLSLTGARLEHEQLLRPGRTCAIELPASLGSLTLAAQVVWSRVVGTRPSAEGRLLRYESGVQFPQLPPEQYSRLGQALKAAATGDAVEGGRLL